MTATASQPSTPRAANSLVLTQRQIDQYRTDGFVMLGRVLDDRTLEELRAQELRFRGDPGKELTIFRAQLANASEPIRRFVTSGRHIEAVKQLVGPNVSLWWNQLVTKLPDHASDRSEFPWHQDAGYLELRPATSITLWFALDDVDQRNGCVWVMPGSHRNGLLPHNKKNTDSWHLTVDVEGDGTPAILKAGEAVAFTGQTLHRSKYNHTDKPRRAFFVEYCDANATMSPEWKPVTESPNSWIVAGETG